MHQISGMSSGELYQPISFSATASSLSSHDRFLHNHRISEYCAKYCMDNTAEKKAAAKATYDDEQQKMLRFQQCSKHRYPDMLTTNTVAEHSTHAAESELHLVWFLVKPFFFQNLTLLRKRRNKAISLDYARAVSRTFFAWARCLRPMVWNYVRIVFAELD